MNDQKALGKVVEAIKNSNNVLVTINRNPDVDQIAAAIALSFILEKLEKFTTTIFSGPVPAAAQFLDPEKTFSSNMETLRDFVISIDKDKVDRLRYKQEGEQVRVYLTPYRTTISQQDLEFNDGDYNIDLVITLGTVTQEDMDNAIIGAIRVLHDATVVAINTGGTVPSYATISWADPDEVAYCEMVADLAELLNAPSADGGDGADEATAKEPENNIDERVATALLTGIVSATDQFRNIKANPKVMQLAAKLMSFGANQQLISIKLEEGNRIDQQQQAALAAQPSQPQVAVTSQSQIEQNIAQNLEATTNAVNVINNDLARSHAENVYQQIAGGMEIRNSGEPPKPGTEDGEQRFDHSQPSIAPQPDAAPWPPKVEDMQHGRDYYDYYHNAPAMPGITPETTSESNVPPVEQPIAAVVAQQTELPIANVSVAPPSQPAEVTMPASMPVMPEIIPDMAMPMAPPPSAFGMNGGEIPMPPMPVPANGVMNDLANYAPPEIQPPTLPQTEPTPGFFSPPPVSVEAQQLPPVPQDITSRTFMTNDPSLNNPGGIQPAPGDEQVSEDTAGSAMPAPELADLSSIAAQATPDELSSDSGRASFNVSEELGNSQGPNPFLTQSSPGPEVNDPAAQLQQPNIQITPPVEIPNSQFKIPGY